MVFLMTDMDFATYEPKKHYYVYFAKFPQCGNMFAYY